MPKTINTNLPSVSTGDVLTATAYNNAITSLNSTTVPPMCKVKRSGDLSYTSSAAIAWNDEDYDTDAMHDNATNNTRITFATSGIYRVTVSIMLAYTTSNVSVFDLSIMGNGSTVVGQNYLYGISQPSSLAAQATTIVDSATYSYVTCQLGIIGGSAYSIKADPRCWFAAELIGRTS